MLENSFFDKKFLDILKKVDEVKNLQLLTNIIRFYDEIIYMRSKKQNLSFEMNNVPGFLFKYDKKNIFIYYNSTEFKYSFIQLKNLVAQIYDYINAKYKINVDYRNFDSVYLSLFLYKFIPRIKKTYLDEMYIDDFRLLRYKAHDVDLNESESYKALLKGQKNCKVYTPFNSNHVVDSDYERLMMTYKSIKKYNYPKDKRYIILYNNEPYIRDGQHRAAVIKYLFGNIKIPVQRIEIDGDINDD